MRVAQKQGEKGSLKWIQSLVNDRPDLLDSAVCPAVGLGPGDRIQWKSPLRIDDLSEYRDGSWLKLVGHGELIPELKDFWPSRGPQWDAVGKSGDRVILVEAKAHAREVVSPGTAAGPKSAAKIDAALAQAKSFFGVEKDQQWSASYYQYANRLAHLYFLRKHKVDAHLVFLYLVGDQSMNLPASREQWAEAIASAHKALGLTGPIDGVHEVFLDVGRLA